MEEEITTGTDVLRHLNALWI